MKKFDIYLAELPDVAGGHVQKGIRPVIVISNDVANAYSPLATIVPLTSRVHKKRLPTHVLLLAKGLSTVSLALCEQILTVDRNCLLKYRGSVTDPEDRAAIEHAVSVQLGLTTGRHCAA